MKNFVTLTHVHFNHDRAGIHTVYGTAKCFSDHTGNGLMTSKRLSSSWEWSLPRSNLWRFPGDQKSLCLQHVQLPWVSASFSF